MHAHHHTQGEVGWRETGDVAGALFGLTRPASSFKQRLWALANGVVELNGDSDQHVAVTCRIDGDVPASEQDTVLRLAREFVGNAVKHGMRMRLIGRIDVSVSSGGDGTTLLVEDDGWDCAGAPVAHDFSASFRGRVTLERRDECTLARLVLSCGA